MYDSACRIRSPRVFTIPASAPFVPTLIEALLDGRLVPGFPPAAIRSHSRGRRSICRRGACRLARDRFLDVTGTTAAILPRIIAVGDVDEDEIAFAQAATGAIAADALDLPDALGGLERRLLLAQLVLQLAAAIEPDDARAAPLVANNPASALALADDLARLMDDMTTRQVGWEKLDGLVPDNLDEYWQLTLRFLKIAREQWPKILAAHGKIGAGRAPRRADQGRSRAARRQDRRPRHRGRLDRVHAGDGCADRNHREAAAGRGGAARPRHRPRRRHLGADRG